ncbi:hypothetical protein AB3S75_043118 [Citrus x aurantiifolia]
MQVKTFANHFVSSPNSRLKLLSQSLTSCSKTFLISTTLQRHSSLLPSRLCIFAPKDHRKRFITTCISSSQEFASENDISDTSVSLSEEKEEEKAVEVKTEGLADQSIWNQIKEIMKFTGPATGLWICGPLMSLIDTAVIGQGSSLELAALGPGTVLCDNMSYIFMFLSIATSNLVATSLTKQDKNEVQHQISVLLFVGLACGFSMLIFTKFFGMQALFAFTGSKNVHILPAANKYVQIRGLAWPAVLTGWVAQSASLGMKDSWGPLKALVVASAVNGIGDIVLCRFLGYGIAGAAWATMASQVIAAYMMIINLNQKGYNAFTISIPLPNELLAIFELAAPVFVMMMSKVAFFTLLTYFATSMGTITLAAHQVMIQTLMMCTVWGEPLAQTAQSFMPEFLYGMNRNLAKARMLLKSLVIIGAILGVLLAIVGTSVPWLFPNIFTPDKVIVQEMHKVLVAYFVALIVTPAILSLEGTLLAGRDLKFVSFSMSGCFSLGALALLLVSGKGYGLPGCWYVLVGFQWTRFFLAFQRLLSPTGILYSENVSKHQLEKLKAA